MILERVKILLLLILLLPAVASRALTSDTAVGLPRKILLLQAARNSVRAENYEPAVQRFTDYLLLEPADGQVALELAVLLYQLDRKDEAIEICKDAIEQLTVLYQNDSGNAEVLLQQAHLTRWVRDLKQAEKWYQRYLALKPYDKQVRLEQARLAGWDLRYDDALSYYRKMVGDFPEEPRYELEMKAKHNNWLGRPTKASKYYIKALELEPNEPELVFDLGQMYSRRGFSLRAEDQYRRTLALVSNHSMAPTALLAEQWRRRQYAKVEQSYVSKEGRDDEVGIEWWRTDLTYSPDREAEATDWQIGIGESFFSFKKHSSMKAAHVNLGLDKRYENTMRFFGDVEFTTYDRRPHQSLQFAGDISYRVDDITEVALIAGRQDVLESFNTLDIDLSRYYLGARIVIEPFNHTELLAQAKQFRYSDDNRGSEYDLRAYYMLSKYPRILRLVGRVYGFDTSSPKDKYWTPSNYSQSSWGLSWYHYLGRQHFEGAEKLYYFIEGFMSIDSDDEPGTEFKTGIVYDSNRQWKIGIEFGMTDSDVYEGQRGMAFVRRRW